MAVITISRELGSEGDKVAELIAHELGYRWVDKAILTQMAQEAGIAEEALLALEHSFATRAKLTSTDMRSLYSKQPSAWENKAALDDGTYRRILRETMEKYATEGNAIIIGRGGQMILRDWPSALHVHLFAPVDIRTQRIMQRLNIFEAEAARRVAASDEEKRQFIRYMHDNANWKDPKYYHLIINTGAVTPEVAEQIIMLAAKDR